MNHTNPNQLIYQSMYAPDGLWCTFHKAKKYQNKMNLMVSLPIEHTNICHERRINKGYKNKNCICTKCYSYTQSSAHPAIRDKMTINSNILNDPDYQPSKIDTINNCLRYISFGELQNKIQATNIFKHARKNKHLMKAVWSKQNLHIQNTIKDLNITDLKSDKRYKNFNLIWSCGKINCTKFFIPKNFTKSFYVYRTEKDRQDAITKAHKEGFKTFICHADSCHNCQHCYQNHDQTIVMELLK